MPSVAEWIAQGKEHHRAGRWSAAEVCCRQALAIDPADPEATYLLGAVCLELGNFDQAAELLARAARQKPERPEVHHQLAAALERRGNLDQAVEHCRRALELEPDRPQLHVDLGRVQLSAGRLDAALDCFRRAIQLDPRHAGALCGLAAVLLRQDQAEQAAHCIVLVMEMGSALGAQDKLDEATECFRQVVATTPQLAEAHNNLGFVLSRQDKLDEALAGFRRAIELRPDYGDAYTNLCIVLRRQQKYAEAEAAGRQALALLADVALAHFNLGTVLADQDKSDEALACFHRALELDPRCTQAHNNLGVLLYRLHQFELALSHCRQAVAIAPNDPDPHVSLATGLLLTGRFAEAWPHYEWRFRVKGNAEGILPEPRWDGSPLAGRTILLRCEQGLGDSLQFIRYAQPLKQQGATVLVQCPRQLVTLLASCPGVDQVTAEGDAPPRFDCHVPLLSLPGLLDPSLSAIPPKVPYLFPDPQRVEHWRHELGGEEALRVGVAWQGRPTQFNDRLRSMPLVQFAGLARTAGVRLYSLQKGPGREQLAEVAGRWPIVDLGEQLGDFHNTAAIVRNLDLVITCDSAPAHLAGALGLNVWVALPFSPDWRWQLGRADSPWYPTMRLFRQPAAGDWDGAFRAIEAALVGAVATRGRG